MVVNIFMTHEGILWGHFDQPELAALCTFTGVFAFPTSMCLLHGFTGMGISCNTRAQGPSPVQHAVCGEGWGLLQSSTIFSLAIGAATGSTHPAHNIHVW